MSGEPKVGDLAMTAKRAESDVPKWLAVLARCFQLQDAVDIIELDRVLAESPLELDAYRRGQTEHKEDGRELISRRTSHLLDRMNAAVGTANAKMIWSRTKALDIVHSANHLAAFVHDFHGLLRIESDPRSWHERQLGITLEMGAQAIQKTKDTAPYAAAGVGLVGLIGVGKKYLDQETPGEG